MRDANDWADLALFAINRWLDAHHTIGVDCTLKDWLECVKLLQLVEDWQAWCAKRGPREIRVVMGEPEPQGGQLTKSESEVDRALLRLQGAAAAAAMCDPLEAGREEADG